MILREMLVEDLDQVMEIEKDLFSVPWTKEGFLTFVLKDNAMFLVVEDKGDYECCNQKNPPERRNWRVSYAKFNQTCR